MRNCIQRFASAVLVAMLLSLTFSVQGDNSASSASILQHEQNISAATKPPICLDRPGDYLLDCFFGSHNSTSIHREERPTRTLDGFPSYQERLIRHDFTGREGRQVLKMESSGLDLDPQHLGRQSSDIGLQRTPIDHQNARFVSAHSSSTGRHGGCNPIGFSVGRRPQSPSTHVLTEHDLLFVLRNPEHFILERTGLHSAGGISIRNCLVSERSEFKRLHRLSSLYNEGISNRDYRIPICERQRQYGHIPQRDDPSWFSLRVECHDDSIQQQDDVYDRRRQSVVSVSSPRHAALT